MNSSEVMSNDSVSPGSSSPRSTRTQDWFPTSQLAGIIVRSALRQEMTPLESACANGAALTSSRAISRLADARRTQNGLPLAFESYRSRVHSMLSGIQAFSRRLETPMSPSDEISMMSSSSHTKLLG